MAVYVDYLRKDFAGRANAWRYHQHCHLLADSRKELLVFVRRLGLYDSYCHGHGHRFHCDLSPRLRAKAVDEGAVELDHIGLKRYLKRAKAAKKH